MPHSSFACALRPAPTCQPSRTCSLSAALMSTACTVSHTDLALHSHCTPTSRRSAGTNSTAHSRSPPLPAAARWSDARAQDPYLEMRPFGSAVRWRTTNHLRNLADAHTLESRDALACVGSPSDDRRETGLSQTCAIQGEYMLHCTGLIFRKGVCLCIGYIAAPVLALASAPRGAVCSSYQHLELWQQLALFARPSMHPARAR